MTDFPLYLPEGVYLKTLVIDPGFSTLSETMQRAVSLIILSDDEGLKINGLSVVETFQQSTSAGAGLVVKLLNSMTPYLTSILNAGDGLPGDEENLVQSTEFSVAVEGTTAKIMLNITMADDKETESTVVYQYA